MPDREMVLKGIECEEYNKCPECPYVKFGECKVLLMRDVRKLLKEQEAVEPVPDYIVRYWRCPKCNWLLISMIDDKCDIPLRRDNYCAKCGRKLKWDAAD